MIENREKEFFELRDKALAKLEYIEDGPTKNLEKRFYPIFRIYHYPSFGIYKSWTLFYPKGEAIDGIYTIAREVKWDRPSDYERFNNPMEGIKYGFSISPSIEVNDAIVKLDEANKYLAALKKIKINVLTENKSIGIDGESFGFQSYEFKGAIRLNWWCQGPEEWKEFIEWVTQIREFMINHFTPWPE